MTMLNALTVDVEDYYQVSAFDAVLTQRDWHRYESRVEKNTHLVLELLADAQVKATFFILGWVAERHPRLVQAIAMAGHEIACHGYKHQRIYTMAPQAFRQETQTAKRLIEDAAGVGVVGYRAASYSITAKSLWALDILAEEGFTYDSSVFPIRHDLYGIPDHPRFFHTWHGREGLSIAELPISTVRLRGVNIPVAGGGYFRLFPYAMSRWAIRYLNQTEQQSAIVYFHPWELDPQQPRIQAGWKSQFRHYTNLKRMAPKLRRLLGDFSFAPIREVYATQLAS